MSQCAEKDIARISSYFTNYGSRDMLPDANERYLHAAREEAYIRALQNISIDSLNGLSILDFGCGTGAVSRRFVELGADASRLIGVDVTRERIAVAKESNRDIRFEVVGQSLPFADSSFDLVLAFTVFSSMLESPLKKHSAQELWRVLSPGGSILWFDFVWNPSNKNTKGIGLAEMRALFPNAKIQSRRVILAPPVSRHALRAGRLVHAIAGSLPFLRSHRIATLTKESQ